jgi:hypothetical protein
MARIMRGALGGGATLMPEPALHFRLSRHWHTYLSKRAHTSEGMVRRKQVPMLPIPLVLVLSLALVLVCSAIPWVARTLRNWPLSIVLVVGGIAIVVGALLALPQFPWLDLVVLVAAWSGGLLLGRSVAPGFRPFLYLFLCLSVADVLLTGGVSLSSHHTSGGATPLRFADFLLLLPGGRFEIGAVDILLLTALAEHWRRRGAAYLIALLPGALGYVLALGFVQLTGLGIVPGIPFFTVGYALTEWVYQSRSRRNAPPAATMAR